MRREDLIKAAIELNASDIHIAPYARPMLRVNGMLQAIEGSELSSNEVIAETVKALCDDVQLKKLEMTGELNFSFSVTEFGRFRVNIVKQRGTYSISIRILKLVVPSKESLGLPDSVFELAEQGRGLLLVSGASGSGRSTTMAAIVQHLNDHHKLNIITVESPIEYLFKHGQSIVLQRDVGTDTESIYEGVRSIMRHDPDVVMISDIGEDNIAELALQIAESGKLVIAGLSSINAVTSIESLIAMSKQERIANRKLKLSHNLLGVISQLLVPGKFEGGRVLVYELLLPNAATRTHIMADALQELRNTLIVGKKQGMVNLDTNLFEKYIAGDITQETLHKYAQDIDYIKRMEKLALKGDFA
ncbi:MAG TPA: hypothetical protein DCS67_03385 [Clostridiales bacterium UBA8960]|jgi:twitching motility protein PilT|nr:hypothetical protein [Clostridiales bacterium UBA8960]